MILKEQINDAVNSLDQQTQQNAAIASQTHNVAVVTDEIAKLVVSNANAKEFDGKKIHDKILTEMGLLQGEKYQWGKIVSEYDVRSNISSINIYYT